MDGRSFYNADGDFLLIPQQGSLSLVTELGLLLVPPGSIAIVPRGLKFSVLLSEGPSRGYVAEVYGRHFELPDRGPVGANGLTDPRHFHAPVARHEDLLHPGYRISAKFCGKLFDAFQDHSPYDVVAWHGNYVPYVYDLLQFSPVANVRIDHADPSIFTVLSAPLDEQGAHSLDFVFFPPRWEVSEHTFRPPFFHRNATTEINGVIMGAQHELSPFCPGGCFVTPSMTAHGVRAPEVLGWMRDRSTDPDQHRRTSERSMWFQFETALPINLSRWAQRSPHRVEEWPDIWGTHRAFFRPKPNSD